MDNSLDDSIWVGTSPGGDKFYELRFNKGGGFSGNFIAGASLMIAGQNKLDGSWNQSGNSINVTLAGRLKGQEFKAARNGDVIKGSWGQLTYSFEVTRVYAKPLVTNDADEASACNLRGMKVTVFYRDKDRVNLLEVANKVAEKLRGTGAQVDVQKGNLKEHSEHVLFYNGQSQVAARIAECISDAARVTPADGGVSYTMPNVFQIYLQTPSPGSSKTR
jgi:hypothetical protein